MKKKTSAKKHFRSNLILTSLIFVLALILSYFHSFDFLNWKIFDQYLRLLRKEPVKSKNVAIICIDQYSLNMVDTKLGQSWPWPRDFYAQTVRYLASCGAKAVIFDIIFSEPDLERVNASGSGADYDFGNAIKESGITYLTAAIQGGKLIQNSYDNRIFIQDNQIFSKFRLKTSLGAIFPITVLYQDAKGIGFANYEPEDDGVVRRYPLLMKFGSRLVPSTSFIVAKDIFDNDSLNRKLFNNSSFKTIADNESKILLNWYGLGGPGGAFDYLSFYAVLYSSTQKEAGETPLIPDETFRDKIIFVGSNAAGLLDMKTTPFTYKQEYPGVEIHATAIQNLIDNNLINRIPFLWSIIAAFFSVSVLFLFFNKLYRNLYIYILLFFSLILIQVVSAYILLIYNNWYSVADVILSTAGVFSGLVVSGYFSETKDKKLLRKQFELYVNESVLEDILENPSAVDFSGRSLIATVMATDIQDFTSISENLPVREVVMRLNDYLSDTTDCLLSNGGFVNKYIGDAILVIFGAFEEADHRNKACRAACETRKIIDKKISDSISKNETPFITRFGITTGEIMMGNIGSKNKLEYTVIGDTVNSAFRLEGLNKFYGTKMLVSEHTVNNVIDDFEFRFIDMIKYKGKTIPVKIFELLGLKGDIEPFILDVRDRFEEALELYRNHEFLKAVNLFSGLSAEGDKPSEIFAERCVKFNESPPPPDWNGIWQMMGK